MREINRKSIGRIGLSMAINYFTIMGYTVSLPMNDTQWYDLVIEKDGKFETVQCKATQTKDKTIDFRSTGGTNGGVYDNLLNHPERFVYYKPKDLASLKVTQYNTYFGEPVDAELFNDPANLDNSSYYLVLGTDERIVHVENPKCKNGRNLVIFKDSYGNALLPFLVGSFENIYLCDIRYFNLNAVSFAEEVECTDMLFAMCTYSAVGPNKDYIYWNINQ